QVGADAKQTISFTLFQGGGFGISGIAAAAGFAGSRGGFSTVATLSISTQDKAQNVLGAVDKMIAGVDSKRAELGAIQNRMESTIRNQANIAENLSSARSRVRDADFAVETAALTQYNILQQAASTVLAQANQRPNGALSLLR
ncbi:TPA: flagellin, partial [Aeromonas veronii]